MYFARHARQYAWSARSFSCPHSEHSFFRGFLKVGLMIYVNVPCGTSLLQGALGKPRYTLCRLRALIALAAFTQTGFPQFQKKLVVLFAICRFAAEGKAMAKGRIFEYAVIYHPKAKKDKEGNEVSQKSEILKDVERVLAASEDQVAILAGRAIPEAYLDKLEDVEIVVRSF